MAGIVCGLDIGHRHVRAVKVKKQGSSYKVLGTAVVDRFDDDVRKPLEVSLAEIDSRLPLKGSLTVASSDLAHMVRFEHNDPMPPDRMERVLRLELSQHTGLEATDMAADAVAIPIAGDEVIHCCGMAQPPQVLELLEDLKRQKIQADRVQLAPAGMANLLDRLPPLPLDDEGDPIGADGFDVVIDVGAQYTRILLVRDGEFIACRQVQVGGNTFTDYLSQQHELSFADAEKVKLGDPSAPMVLTSRSGIGGPVNVMSRSGSMPKPQIIKNDGAELALDEDFGDVAADDDVSAEEPTSDVFLSDDQDSPVDSLNLDEEPGEELGLLDSDDALVLEDSDDFSLTDEDDQADLQIADEAQDSLASDALFLDESDEAEPVADAPQLDLFSDEAVKESADQTDSLTAATRFRAAPTASVEQEATAAPVEEVDEPVAEDDSIDMPGPGTKTIALGTATLGQDFMRAAEELFSQVSKSLAWFQGQLKVRRVEVNRVYLVGMGAELTGLHGYLSRRFGKPVEAFDPFVDMTGQLPERGGHFAQALGLALTAKPRAINFDLRPESLQRQMLLRTVVVWPQLAAVLVVVAVAALLYGLYLQQQYHSESLELYQAHQAEKSRLNSAIGKEQGTETRHKQDLREIASRIFAGRDLLDSIRALKKHAPESLWITKYSTTGIGKNKKADSGKNSTAATIDRGALYLEGFVKPEADEEFSEWFQHVIDWKDAVVAYQTKQRQRILFKDFELIEVPWDDGDGKKEPVRPFIVRFDFKQTEIDANVTTAEGRNP